MSMRVRVCVCVYVYIYVCVCVCVWMCVCVCKRESGPTTCGYYPQFSLPHAYLSSPHTRTLDFNRDNISRE